MTLPVQSIRCGAFLPSGAESGLEVHDQCDRTPRPGIHTVDHGRTLAGRIQMRAGGTNDLVGCTVPARLFPETQRQTGAHSVTVQNGSVREVKRSMPFGSGRCRQNGLGSKSEMLHHQSDEGPYVIQVYPV